MPALVTKTKQLTAYALACGYIERTSTATLWREHNVYHVRGVRKSKEQVWQTFRTLASARKFFLTIK